MNPSANALRALAPSWVLAMEAENKSSKTVTNYGDSLELFARWLDDRGHAGDLETITPDLIRTWIAELIDTRAASTARTRWNGLRSFFAWALEEGEITINPMTLVKGPSLPEKLVPMITTGDLKALLDACQGPLLVDRRDEAMILLFADTGGRRSEVAGARLEDLDLRGRTLLVTGKGARERVLPFGARTARAIDRYLRLRSRTKYADGPWLWISGKDGRALTSQAVYQMVRRRARAAGVAAYPHLFRHGFAHEWLRAGGSEGDLMELAGWRSRQMLNRYGAAGRAERARAAYQGRSPMDNLE